MTSQTISLFVLLFARNQRRRLGLDPASGSARTHGSVRATPGRLLRFRGIHTDCTHLLGRDPAYGTAGDSAAHQVTWQAKKIDELKGQVLRIEFQLKMADLYSFRAAP